MKKKLLALVLFNAFITCCFCQTPGRAIWNVGKANNSAAEFALALNGFKNFVGQDFGYEDKYFLIGYSKEKTGFPYVLPGPADTWGGTWPTAGWRTNQVNILFGIDHLPAKGSYKLVIKLLDHAKKFLPLVKVSISDQDENIQLGSAEHDVTKQPAPRLNEPFIDTASLAGNLSSATPEIIEIPVRPDIIKKGGNKITITVVDGSWIMFDEVQLQGPATVILMRPGQLFLHNVVPADYELQVQGKRLQPLLVNAEYLKGAPRIAVELDAKVIFNEILEKGNYEFEALMPAVSHSTRSRYRILENAKVI